MLVLVLSNSSYSQGYAPSGGYETVISDLVNLIFESEESDAREPYTVFTTAYYFETSPSNTIATPDKSSNPPICNPPTPVLSSKNIDDESPCFVNNKNSVLAVEIKKEDILFKQNIINAINNIINLSNGSLKIEKIDLFEVIKIDTPYIGYFYLESPKYDFCVDEILNIVFLYNK